MNSNRSIKIEKLNGQHILTKAFLLVMNSEKTKWLAYFFKEISVGQQF